MMTSIGVLIVGLLVKDLHIYWIDADYSTLSYLY